jgi:FtsZ-interacting cell division protein YlmF
MAFKDLIRDFEGLFSRVRGDGTRRPDGGTSHYSPMRKKTADQAAQQSAGNMQYVHTGFTGMTPPSEYGFGQENVNSGSAWTQTAGQTEYSGQAPAGGRYFTSNTGTEAGFPRARQDNISYMPGFAPANRDPQNTLHVEHIMTLTGLKSCYEAIECMKNGETLIVMLDAIANESESMRCQDMLAGAAFTLGCTVRLLAGARIVLIAPEGVLILPEKQGMPEGIRLQEMPATRMNAAAEAPRPGRRERRTSPNAAEWTAARNGEMDNYNPYTGTMPVAAGSYGSFGGYGY